MYVCPYTFRCMYVCWFITCSTQLVRVFEFAEIFLFDQWSTQHSADCLLIAFALSTSIKAYVCILYIVCYTCMLYASLILIKTPFYFPMSFRMCVCEQMQKYILYFNNIYECITYFSIFMFTFKIRESYGSQKLFKPVCGLFSNKPCKFLPFSA